MSQDIHPPTDLDAADACLQEGDFVGAESLLLATLRNLTAEYPEDHKDVLACMEKLADALMGESKWKQAALMLRGLVTIREQAPGSTDKELGCVLMKLARSCEQLKEYDDAVTYFKQANKLLQTQEITAESSLDATRTNIAARTKNAVTASTQELDSMKAQAMTPDEVATASQQLSVFTRHERELDEAEMAARQVARAEAKRKLASTRSNMAAIQQKRAKVQPVTNRQGIQLFAMFVIMIAFILFLILNQPLRQHGAIRFSRYAGPGYKTADYTQILNLSEMGGDLECHKEHYPVRYEIWTGGLGDELGALTGKYDQCKWLREIPQGLATESGAILYARGTLEYRLIHQMWGIAEAAQKYYARTGRYPRHGFEDAPRLKKLNPTIDYINPVTGKLCPPTIMPVIWPVTRESIHQRKNITGKGMGKRCFLEPPAAAQSRRDSLRSTGFQVLTFDSDNFNRRGGSVVNSFFHSRV